MITFLNQLHADHFVLEMARRTREELTALRQVMQTLQRERSVIRHKLEQMLVTIEWLEAHTGSESDAKT